MAPGRDDPGTAGELRAKETEVAVVLGSTRIAIDEVVHHCAGRVKRLEVEMRELRSMLESMGASSSRAAGA